MTTATVLGCDQCDIEEAIEEAGDYGTVYFPNGEYLVCDLQSTRPYQTWEMERGAKIKRNGGGNLLTLTTPGLRIHGGAFDGGRNGDTNSGIAGDGFGVDIEDTCLENVGGWGVIIVDGQTRIRGMRIKNTGHAGILWQSNQFRSEGPLIQDCVVDRWLGYTTSGGIIIKTNNVPGNIIRAPKVINCTVTLPQVPNATQADSTYKDAVGIEIRGANSAVAWGNSANYGIIGVSFAKTANSKMIGNDASSCFNYGLEIADNCSFNEAVGNSAAYCRDRTTSRGVSVSANSNDNLIYCTGINACSVGVGINGDCLRNVVK